MVWRLRFSIFPFYVTPTAHQTNQAAKKWGNEEKNNFFIHIRDRFYFSFVCLIVCLFFKHTNFGFNCESQDYLGARAREGTRGYTVVFWINIYVFSCVASSSSCAQFFLLSSAQTTQNEETKHSHQKRGIMISNSVSSIAVYFRAFNLFLSFVLWNKLWN